MWIYPTVLPPTRSLEWDCAVAYVTIDESESRRERGLEGRRRSKYGQEAETQKNSRGCTGNLYQVFLKSLYFSLPCTNSLIYCMSTEVNGSLQPHNNFPYGEYITTERRCKRGGRREKDWDSKYVPGCTVNIHTHIHTQKMWPVLAGTVYD